MKPDPVLAGAPTFVTMDDRDEINFRELFDIIWSGKWVVAGVLLFCLLAGAGYALVSEPVYEADGLVQVEKEKSTLSASMDELTSLIGGTPTEAPAEIALMKSRMVLGVVASKLRLDIRVRPYYFPVVGAAISRHRSHLLEEAPGFGLRGYAWGGEVLKVTALEVPASQLGKSLTLVAQEDGYLLEDEDGKEILRGTVGQRANAKLASGDISIFVQELIANAGTRFEVQRRPMQVVLDDLLEQLTVAEQPRDSGVLSIKFEADSPEFAALLVNEIEEAYLRQNVERRSAQAEQSLEFLKSQLPDLKAKVDEAQAKLNGYQLQKGTADVQQETSLVLKQSVDLETQRLQLIQERDAALQRFTAQHPVVMTFNEQIRGLEREQESVRKRVESLPEKQQEILSLMRDVEVNQQLYTTLLNSAQELQVTKAGTIGNVRIVDGGVPPLKPVKPKMKLVLALSGFLGLILGVATVFAMRTLLRGVDRPEDVERVIGLPTYASIPYSAHQRRIFKNIRKNTDAGVGVLAALDKDDLAIEALRSLRTSLHFATMEASNNIVMFTGPVPKLGKSFVSINFGAVLALSGQRVVVIDADMRRGRLHRYLGVEQRPGLSDYIAGSGDLQQILHKSPTPGLDMITAGTRPPNPSELLMSERFSEMLKSLSQAYDHVLIDTPPVLPVTDAAIVGRLAGTTLVVLKAAEHPMRAIEETVKRLRQAGVTVRGIVFNQVGARIGSYGYGAYGYAYGYSAYGYKAGGKSG